MCRTGSAVVGSPNSGKTDGDGGGPVTGERAFSVAVGVGEPLLRDGRGVSHLPVKPRS